MQKLLISPLFQRPLTKIAFLLGKSEFKPLKNYLIRYFLNNHTVNLEELEQPDPFQYPSWNHFFTRKKKELSIDNSANSIVSPVDGSVSQFGFILNESLIQAKNHNYSLKDLFANNKISKEYNNGSFITIYLAPTDYHRVHMPVSADLISMQYVPGRLYPVKTEVVNTVEGVFAKNERLICNFMSKYGKFSLILVGAQLVSGLETVWHGPIKAGQAKYWEYNKQKITLSKGQEMGRFNFGSTVILCFPRRLKFSDNVVENYKISLGSKISAIIASE